MTTNKPLTSKQLAGLRQAVQEHAKATSLSPERLAHLRRAVAERDQQLWMEKGFTFGFDEATKRLRGLFGNRVSVTDQLEQRLKLKGLRK